MYVRTGSGTDDRPDVLAGLALALRRHPARRLLAIGIAGFLWPRLVVKIAALQSLAKIAEDCTVGSHLMDFKRLKGSGWTVVEMFEFRISRC